MMKKIIAFTILGALIWGMSTHPIYTFGICAIMSGINNAIEYRMHK